MAQTRLKSGNLHMVGGDNGSDGNVLKSKGDGTMEWGNIIINPTFSSFDYPGDDTALDPAGGQSLVINGSGFNPGVTVTIDGTTPSSITRNSDEQLTVTTPAKSAGSQIVAITNIDGGSASTNVSYNGIPAFTNAAGSLGSIKTGESINVSAAATEPDGGAITYAITSGALPSGVSLNASTGAITGTAPSVSADTTSNFTVTATDNENQSTARAYSITVTPILPSDSFSVVTYTGNGSTQSITGVGFQPDFVWIKSRSISGSNHVVYDTTRGAGEYLIPNTSGAEGTIANGLTSFDSDGFTLGSEAGHNFNGATFVAWCWKLNGGTTVSNTDGTITSTVQANTDVGFSITTFSGTGSTGTLGHGLSVQPNLVLFKTTNTAIAWYVMYRPTGGNVTIFENINTSAPISSNYTNFVPNADTVNILNVPDFNQSGRNYVMYSFASVEGFSKFGTYTGNGSTNGPIVETGFEPAFVMYKGLNSSRAWIMVDNKRAPVNTRREYLIASSTNAEAAVDIMDFFSNGFQIKDTSVSTNGNNETYIYMAFAADPDTTAPTLADSFNAKTYTGNGGTQSITGFGFTPSMIWFKGRTVAYDHGLYDSVRGGKSLIYPSLSQAETITADGIQSFDSDGVTVGSNNKANASDSTYVAWAWKADDNEPTILHETSDAVAIYKFEDNANDVTGNYNGTETDITYATGKFNKAASFNSTSSKILNTSFNAITGNAARSYNVWAYTDGSAEGALVCTGQWGVGGRSMSLYIDQSQNRITLHGYSASYDTQLGTLPTLSNGWHMFTLSWDGSSVFKTYIDGALFSTTIKNATYNTTSYLCIGEWYDATLGVYHFNNLIDQVRVYAGVLTSDSVTNLYNETVSQNSTLDIGTKLEKVKQSIVSANANAGFSIVKYEGDGVQGSKVPHGLSVAPDIIIIKDLSSSEVWLVGNSESGWTKAMHLDLTNADNASNLYWDDTAPTSTVFSLGHHTTAYNVSGNEYIAYCFHSVSEYSKIGSYSGGSTGSGNVITTGFQPDWIMFKRTDTADDWTIIDSVRGDGASSKRLIANTNETEKAATSIWYPTSTGFYFESTGASINASGGTYIYMAFKIN
jgi:hypothetical protein